MRLPPLLTSRPVKVGLLCCGLAGFCVLSLASDTPLVRKPPGVEDHALLDDEAEVEAAEQQPKPPKRKKKRRAPPPAEEQALAPAEPPAEVETKPAERDPMDVLRERLAEKLGAASAGDGDVVRVGPVTAASVASSASDAEAPATTVARAAMAAPEPRAPAKVAAPRAIPWGYHGRGGPEHWGELRAEFALCGKGSRQSPIDIRDGFKVELEPVQFDYRPSAFSVIDNGHTVQANVAAGNFIEVMGRRYLLRQFHFHRPSEERIDGRQFDMTAHLVHHDAEGRQAVVAVLLERGSAHPLVQSVWNNLPLEKGEELPARTPIDLNALLPEDRRYFTYMGSLTTPPCSEGVLWMVMKQPVTVSDEQIGLFARLYPMNARPVQPAAGRMVKESN